MSVWVLARTVAKLSDGDVLEYWTGNPHGPGRSLFRADAYKFHDARAARECADTHRGLQDSEVWRVIEVVDGNRVKSRSA